MTGRIRYKMHWTIGQNWSRKTLLEATPILGYFSTPRKPDRLKLVSQFDPDARIILLFRNPVDRAYSQWSMQHKRGNTDLDFEAAIAHERQIERFHRVHSYASRCEYDRIAEKTLQTFGAEQVLFLKTEELLNHPADVLSRVQQFAGIEDTQLEHKESFKGSYDAKMAPETRDQLRAHFEPHNARFSALTGIDVSDWN